MCYVNGIKIGQMSTNPDTLDGTGILTCAAGQRAFVTKTQIASPNGSASSVGITING